MAKSIPPPKRTPQFVDLFYAVVVGGSLQLILDVNDYISVAIKLFMIVVVLEDWFAYFSFVLPNIVEKQRYTLWSLSMEFGILVFWYLSVVALNSEHRHHHLFSLIAGFFFLRFVAGFRAHWRRSTLYTKESFSEFIYLIHSLFYFGIFFGCYYGKILFLPAFELFVIVYLILTFIWWVIRFPEFRANA